MNSIQILNPFSNYFDAGSFQKKIDFYVTMFYFCGNNVFWVKGHPGGLGNTSADSYATMGRLVESNSRRNAAPDIDEGSLRQIFKFRGLRHHPNVLGGSSRLYYRDKILHTFDFDDDTDFQNIRDNMELYANNLNVRQWSEIIVKNTQKCGKPVAQKRGKVLAPDHPLVVMAEEPYCKAQCIA